MAGPADYRGVSLELGASLPRLWTCLHVSGEGDGHPRSTDLSGSPWQNGCAERLIGTLLRECLDPVVIFSEMHLRRILSAYAAYYNQARTHLALQKDAPLIEQSNPLCDAGVRRVFDRSSNVFFRQPRRAPSCAATLDISSKAYNKAGNIDRAHSRDTPDTQARNTHRQAAGSSSHMQAHNKREDTRSGGNSGVASQRSRQLESEP